MTDDTELRRHAIHRANMKMGFRAHLMAFAIVNAGLVAINLVTEPSYLWFVWPLMGWGIGLVAHGVVVYADGASLRERMIEEEYERLRRRATGP
jgi:hypothetical protein